MYRLCHSEKFSRLLTGEGVDGPNEINGTVVCSLIKTKSKCTVC